MKEFIYGLEEIELIKELILNVPEKVWWNYVDFIFEYDTYYIKISLLSEKASTQNDTDEAIIATITKENNKFVATENETLVCGQSPISEAYIVRSFLYFSSHREITMIERLLKRTKVLLSRIITMKKDPLKSLIAKVTGVHQEISCHPDSEQAKSADQSYANLKDNGLLLKTELGYIRAYIKDNGYGFNVWNNKFFVEVNEMKGDFDDAKFIKIEM